MVPSIILMNDKSIFKTLFAYVPSTISNINLHYLVGLYPGIKKIEAWGFCTPWEEYSIGDQLMYLNFLIPRCNFVVILPKLTV